MLAHCELGFPLVALVACPYLVSYEEKLVPLEPITDLQACSHVMFSNLFVGFRRNNHRIDDLSVNAESYISVAVLMFVFTIFSCFVQYGTVLCNLVFPQFSKHNIAVCDVLYFNMLDYSEICWC
jgi:hypothetical protein